MNRELAKSLIKDYDLPIFFYEEPYFSYFVNLYDPYFQILDKIKLLEATLVNLPQEKFLSEYRKISEEVVKTIASNPHYQQFNTANLSFNSPPQGFAQAQKLYTGEHLNKQLVSVDLVKANFSVLKATDPGILLNADTYEELLLNFTDSEYFIKSKKIRQVIFGNLNPKRQQTLQRHYMSWVKHYLLQSGLKETDILLASSDELVFSAPEGFNIQESVKVAFNQSETSMLNQNYRVSIFTIEKLHPNFDFYVKKYQDPVGKIEFKNVPQNYLAQVVKYFEGQEITEMDRKIMLDGYIATFDKPLLVKP